MNVREGNIIVALLAPKLIGLNRKCSQYGPAIGHTGVHGYVFVSFKKWGFPYELTVTLLQGYSLFLLSIL
jgi:hypothetical protein